MTPDPPAVGLTSRRGRQKTPRQHEKSRLAKTTPSVGALRNQTFSITPSVAEFSELEFTFAIVGLQNNHRYGVIQGQVGMQFRAWGSASTLAGSVTELLTDLV
jgi:hypothetical protein